MYSDFRQLETALMNYCWGLTSQSNAKLFEEPNYDTHMRKGKRMPLHLTTLS